MTDQPTEVTLEVSKESAEIVLDLLQRVQLVNQMILISELLLGAEAYVPTDQLRRALGRFAP